MVQIQYASDLHITDWPLGTPHDIFVTPVAPILVLAGDICSAWDQRYIYFLEWASRNWSTVVVITGNHEYHCSPSDPHTMNETDAYISASVKRFPNVAFLQNGASYVIPGTHIRFVGATLWSAIDPQIWAEIESKKSDFKNVYTDHYYTRRLIKSSDICAVHALHRTNISSELAPHTIGETLIVVTHHMPTQNLLEPHFRHEIWNSCYASNDDDLITSNIAAWICGHSHRATSWKAPNGVMLYMNARGYNNPDELGRTVDLYNPRAEITVKN